jgi:hypothetical protein
MTVQGIQVPQGIRDTTSSLPEHPIAHLLRHAALRFITMITKSRRSLKKFNLNNRVIKIYFNIIFLRILPRKLPLSLPSTRGEYMTSLLTLVMSEAHNLLSFTTLTRRTV